MFLSLLQYFSAVHIFCLRPMKDSDTLGLTSWTWAAANASGIRSGEPGFTFVGAIFTTALIQNIMEL